MEETANIDGQAPTAPPRPSYLPALAFVGVLIGFQNLAIRSDNQPDPFLRPALSVTQAFRIPPEMQPAQVPDTSFLTGAPAHHGHDPVARHADPIAAAILGDGSPGEAHADHGHDLGHGALNHDHGHAAPGDLADATPDDLAPADDLDPVAAVVAEAAAGVAGIGETQLAVAPPPAPIDTAPLAPLPPPDLGPAGSETPAQEEMKVTRPGIHVVQPGDTLFGLSRTFNTTVKEILALNEGMSLVLSIGQEVRVPGLAPPPPQARKAAPLPKGSDPVRYTVKAGDTLSNIARRFEIPMPSLILTNELYDIHNLKPGTQLQITAPDHIAHRVDQGESLWSVARLYDLTVAELVTFNDLDEEVLKIGQTLKVPTAGLDADHLEAVLQRRREAGKRFIYPVYGRTTDDFGMRVHPIYGRKIPHRGVDIAAARGTNIRAARSGTVSFSGRLTGYGNIVEVRHAGGFTTRYAHCSKLLKKKGDRVRKGDVIAKVGATGLATAPHVHFEIRKNGVPKDPMKYL